MKIYLCGQRNRLGNHLPEEAGKAAAWPCAGSVGSPGGREHFSALRSAGSRDLEAVKAFYGSNTASVQHDEGFLDYMMAMMESGWLACISQLMRTHCPFSCFMVYNFSKRNNCKEKELKYNSLILFYF